MIVGMSERRIEIQLMPGDPETHFPRWLRLEHEDEEVLDEMERMLRLVLERHASGLGLAYCAWPNDFMLIQLKKERDKLVFEAECRIRCRRRDAENAMLSLVTRAIEAEV